MNTYPRETVEFQPAPIKVDGVTVTTGIQYAVTGVGVRPTTWVSPTTLGGKTGVMVSGYTPGLYQVWCKVTASPETPVIECGWFEVT